MRKNEKDKEVIERKRKKEQNIRNECGLVLKAYIHTKKNFNGYNFNIKPCVLQ